MLNHALEVLPQFKAVCMLQDHLKYCALALSDELNAHGEFFPGSPDRGGEGCFGSYRFLLIAASGHAH